MKFNNNKSKKNNDAGISEKNNLDSSSSYQNYLKNKIKFESSNISGKNSTLKKLKLNTPIFDTSNPINYTKEITQNNYQKHFQKLSNNSIVPDVPINLPASTKFIQFSTSEIDDNMNTNNKKQNSFNSNDLNSNFKNNNIAQQNLSFQQQLQQQMQFANQLQLMQYRAFLMNQQNQFWQQQMLAQSSNPMFAYSQMMQQNANQNSLITLEQKQQGDSLVNLVSQVSKLMNSFQNQMAMQNDILSRQQKQVIQQQEIINKLHDRLLKDDYIALDNKKNRGNLSDADEEYLEPSDTLNISENDFNLVENPITSNLPNLNNLQNSIVPAFDNSVNKNLNEYSNLTNENLLTNQINSSNLNFSNLFSQQERNQNSSIANEIIAGENLRKNKINEIKNDLEEVDEFLELAKSNPAQRFWEALVGKPKYGFYNNKVWHWLGYFDRLAKWHPYSSASEMPTLPIIHTGLIKQNSTDSTFWKRLIDNPEYGHREEGIWIWDGVFDQNCNWIPDPTSDKYVINNYSRLIVKSESLPNSQLPVKKIDSSKVENILDSYNPLDFVGNEFYGYYDDNKKWVWTAEPGSLEKQNITKSNVAPTIAIKDNLNASLNDVATNNNFSKEPELLIELPKNIENKNKEQLNQEEVSNIKETTIQSQTKEIVNPVKTVEKQQVVVNQIPTPTQIIENTKPSEEPKILLEDNLVVDEQIENIQSEPLTETLDIQVEENDQIEIEEPQIESITNDIKEEVSEQPEKQNEDSIISENNNDESVTKKSIDESIDRDETKNDESSATIENLEEDSKKKNQTHQLIWKMKKIAKQIIKKKQKKQF